MRTLDLSKGPDALGRQSGRNIVLKDNFREPSYETVRELDNFREIAAHVIPDSGEVPALEGIDVYGRSIPQNGVIGGDHIIYLDFKKRYDLDARIAIARQQGEQKIAQNLERCRSKAGIALADVSGHQLTDALLAMMLHQSFLLGVIYELDFFGEITTRLFENVNSRFFKSSSVSKFLSLIYGEITQDGKFRFISAAHPLPVVFSRRYDRIVDIAPEHLITFPPIGTMPSSEDVDRRILCPPLGFKEEYHINEIDLIGIGDIMLLYSDGLSEHEGEEEAYFPDLLEKKLREVKDRSAWEIFEAILADAKSLAPLSDDLSLVVVKRV